MAYQINIDSDIVDDIIEKYQMKNHVIQIKSEWFKPIKEQLMHIDPLNEFLRVIKARHYEESGAYLTIYSICNACKISVCLKFINKIKEVEVSSENHKSEFHTNYKKRCKLSFF